LPFGILIITSVILVSIAIGIRPVEAQADYSIGQVFHTVKIMYNGYVFINDTFELSNMTVAPSNFLMGFPDKYGQDVLKCVAFNDSTTFPVTLNTPLDGHMGFYGVNVVFPHGAPQIFTVAFVLSNSLLTENSSDASLYELDFPAYPSLMKNADLVNVSIIVPEGAVFAGGTVSGPIYAQQDLPELTRLPATLDFNATGTTVPIVEITQLSRVFAVTAGGEITGADTYKVTNDAQTGLDSFRVFLPPNASNPVAVDLSARGLPLTLIDAATNHYEVGFSISVTGGESGSFVVKYFLPGSFITQSSNEFTLNIPLFEHEDYYIDEALVTIVPPEGATINVIENNSTLGVYSLGKTMYQETMTLSQEGMIVLGIVDVAFSYDYNPLWASFRPTVWVWALAVLGCVVVTSATRGRSKGQARTSVSAETLRLGPEFLRSFVDKYEEKKKMDVELDSLEARAEKGRIPRRRYKVMRKTLETRLEAALRELNKSKERMRAAGGKYSGFMLQLEVAEAEIGEVKANIKNAESLHNRGDLSLEAYRNRLADYQSKKERAETTISGILLRLREETQ